MKLEKVKGAKGNCPVCGDEMICVEVPASGKYPARLQWQNPEGGAHYNFDGTNTSCNRKTVQTLLESHPASEPPKNMPTIEKCFDDAVKLSNLAWDYANKKAMEIMQGRASQGDRDGMILTQVLYKGIVELMKK